MNNSIAFILIAIAGLCSGQVKPEDPKEVMDGCLLSCSRTILHHAVEVNNVQRLKELLKGGKNMYATDCNGLTPMHYAITSKRNTKNLVLAFLNNDFDVFRTYGRHDKILFYAIRNGSNEAVDTLLKYSGHHKMENRNFLTPIQVAVQCKRVDVAKLLMKHGANIDKDGSRYIYKAIESGDIEEIEIILSLGFKSSELKNLNYIKKAIDRDRPGMVNFLVKYTPWTGCPRVYNTWKKVLETAKNSNTKNARNALLENLKWYGCIRQLSPEKWESVPMLAPIQNGTENAV